MTTLNAAVAEQLIAFKAALDVELAKGKELNVAIMDTLKPIIASIVEVVCFDGNGYAESWQLEAKRRGLDVETSVPKMFEEFIKPASVEMFTSTGVYTAEELFARNEVKWETYSKKIQIESRVMVRMALNHIIPAAIDYKSTLLKVVSRTKEVFGDLSGCELEVATLKRVSDLIAEISAKAEDVRKATIAASEIESEHEKALAFHEVAESLFALRKPIDTLEDVVDNKLWPLPKYRELLFIS